MIEIAADFATAGIAVALGWIAADVVVGPADAALERRLDEAAAAMAARLTDRRPQDLPAVAATRAAYKALGKDPARYRPAAEALLRRVAQGKGVYRVNNVVDVNNLASLESGFSSGTYDVAKLVPPLAFRPGRADEVYEGIGRGPLNLEGLPVFVDRVGPFGSPTSDSVRSSVATETAQILMVVIGFRPAMVEAAQLEQVRNLLETHCRARIRDAQLVVAG